jgi:O-antigen/teichoic acid export membrane protein
MAARTPTVIRQSAPALAGAAWLLAGRLFGDALAFGLFVLVAREFGPAGTGSYFFHFAIATIFYELVSLGIEEYGVREYAQRERGARGALLSSLFGAQLLIGFLVGASLLLASMTRGKVLLPLLAFMLAYQLCFAVSRTLFIPAFVRGQVWIQVLAEVAVRAAVLLIALTVIQTSNGAPSLVLSLVGFPIVGVAVVAFGIAIARRFDDGIELTLSFRELGVALKALWPFAAANVVTGIYTRSGILVLFVVAGGIDAGLFASAYKFAELSWALLALVPLAGYAHLARMLRESDRDFRVLSARLLRATLLAGGALAWGTYWILPPLIASLLGSEFEHAVPILRALTAAVALLAINEYLERILLVVGRQMPRLHILLVQAVSNLLLNILLVPRFGITGTVVAFIASQAIVVPLFIRTLRVHIPLGDLVRSIVIYAFALAGAVLIAELPGSTPSAFWLAPLFSLAAFILICHAGGLLRSMRAAECVPSRPVLGI